MAKRVPAIILFDPGEYAEASHKEHSTDDASNRYWETDMGRNMFVRMMPRIQLSFQKINKYLQRQPRGRG
jgi:hypothetical protein